MGSEKYKFIKVLVAFGGGLRLDDISKINKTSRSGGKNLGILNDATILARIRKIEKLLNDRYNLGKIEGYNTGKLVHKKQLELKYIFSFHLISLKQKTDLYET